MYYGSNSKLGMKEILATDAYQAVPIKVAAPEEGNIVRAGTPLTSAGVATTGENAVGILLYDVNTDENANAAIVVSGLINAVAAQAWSGVTYDVSALKAALPGIRVRTNVKTEGGDTPGGDDVVGTAIVGTSVVH